jgi:uncharacterized protein (TIGR02646 family)
VCAHYESYRDTLREDFNKRCGYCDDTDLLRIRSFTIDHFVPRNPKDFKHDIEPNYYYNLVYACHFCNSAKSNKWMTTNVKESHDGERGFIDPTSDDYTNFFRRDKSGKIHSNGVNDVLAQFIVKELKLWLPIHEITWKLERLIELSNAIEEKINSETDEALKQDLEVRFNEIEIGLAKIFRNLFVENE